MSPSRSVPPSLPVSFEKLTSHFTQWLKDSGGPAPERQANTNAMARSGNKIQIRTARCGRICRPKRDAPYRTGRI